MRTSSDYRKSIEREIKIVRRAQNKHLHDVEMWFSSLSHDQRDCLVELMRESDIATALALSKVCSRHKT